LGARFSTPVQTGLGAHPASYTMGTGSFPGVKRPGRGVNHPPNVVPSLKKSRAISRPHLCAFHCCKVKIRCIMGMSSEARGWPGRLAKL